MDEGNPVKTLPIIQIESSSWSPEQPPRGLRSGFEDSKPVLLALAPVAFALGAAVTDSAFTGLSGWLAGPLLLSGAAQFAMISVLADGAGAITALIAALVLSSRLLLFSAALSPRFRDQPLWFRAIGPHFLVDQTYILVDEHVPVDEEPQRFRRYWFGCTLPMVAVWVAMISVGMALGPVVPAGWRLELAGAVLITTMLRPALADRSGLIAAIVGGVSTYLLADVVGASAVIAGATVGMAAAWYFNNLGATVEGDEESALDSDRHESGVE